MGVRDSVGSRRRLGRAYGLWAVFTVASGLTAASQTACQPAAESDRLFVKGSDTMRILVQRWVEAYEQTARDTRVSVGGGGSGVGMYALLNGLVDICASSRPMTAKERRVARRKSLDIFEFSVARDGIAVIVHPSNRVSALSLADLGLVFTGTATTWAAVGGAKRPISVLLREKRSGTHRFFKDHVLLGREYRKRASVVASTAAVINAVATDPTAIGYVGLGYAAEARGQVRTVAIHNEAGVAIRATVETVTADRYPLARSLFLLTAERPSGPVARFIEFARSDAGQDIVTATGFAPAGSAEARRLGASSARGEEALD